jgi:hypothetical protein
MTAPRVGLDMQAECPHHAPINLSHHAVNALLGLSEPGTPSGEGAEGQLERAGDDAGAHEDLGDGLNILRLLRSDHDLGSRHRWPPPQNRENLARVCGHAA